MDSIHQELAKVERNHKRRLDRFFSCASFPTPASEAYYQKLVAKYHLEKVRVTAPRLVKNHAAT